MTQKTLPDNPNFLISDNGAPITSDGGNVLVGMFLNSSVVSTVFHDVTFSDRLLKIGGRLTKHARKVIDSHAG